MSKRDKIKKLLSEQTLDELLKIDEVLESEIDKRWDRINVFPKHECFARAE